MTVHPGGIAEWCRSRFVDLKVKPPKTGVTVYICLESHSELVSRGMKHMLIDAVRNAGCAHGTNLPIGQIRLLDHVPIVQSIAALSGAKRETFS
jgi:hypothetical protein